MSRVLVTGSAGFIGGYVVAELLGRGYDVTGIDNLSKYGRPPSPHPRYRFVEGDVKDLALMSALAQQSDWIIAGAAMIGGISYFHAYPYDLLAENERIIAATCDAAIAGGAGMDRHRLRNDVYESSSLCRRRHPLRTERLSGRCHQLRRQFRDADSQSAREVHRSNAAVPGRYGVLSRV